MTKRKVIEDSDDDENAAATPPRALASTLFSLDGSPSNDLQDQNPDPSTSSTGPYPSPLLSSPLTIEANEFKELFNRESRAAHQSLIEPTPKSAYPAIEAYSCSQQQTPTSPTAPRLKTKRSKTSVEKPKARKPLKTYGQSSQDPKARKPLKVYGQSNQDIFEFHGGSDGELDTAPRMDLDHKPEKSKSNEKRRIDRAVSRRGSQNEGVLRKTITSSGGDTEMLSTEPKSHEISSAAEQEGSLQSSMPPPASKSTSFDQSQQSQKDTMREIADPVASESSTSSVLPPAVVTYPEAHSEDQFTALMRPIGGTDDEGGSQDLAQSVKFQSTCSDEAKRRLDLESTAKSVSSSSAFEILPSTTVTDEGMNRTNDILEELSLHLGSSLVGSALEPHMSMTINPAVLLPAPTDTDSVQDELSLSVPEAANSSVAKPPKAPKRKRNTDEEPLDELGSDDNALGVPKEHYQPRPSKRRAGGGDNEIVVPTDFSKRPEAIAKNKRKTKRHKTTAFQELLPKDEDEDEEIKVVPDPRFEIPEKKKTPKLSTESDQPDLERHDNTEDIRHEAQIEPNQAPKSTGQKKRGRPKKAVTNLSEETVVDEIEADHNYDSVEIDEHVLSASAKKSKKKTKTKETAPPIIDEQNKPNGTSPAAQNDPEVPLANTTILNETNGNTIPAKSTTQSSPSTLPAKANAAPPETPHKATTPAPKGPDKHSPISSAKVAYRVGLSKKARIAPLLKIVRK